MLSKTLTRKDKYSGMRHQSSNRLYYYVAYALLYAFLVTAITWVLAPSSIVLKIEQAIYDPLQKLTAIDHQNQLWYEEYEPELKEIFCINLDSTFFDLKTEHARRANLASLMETLAEKPPLAVFLDYPFVSIDGWKTGNDILLAKSLEHYGEQLVLPYPAYWNGNPLEDKLKAESMRLDTNLLYTPKHQGFFLSLPLPKDDVHRYYAFRTNKKEYHSVVYGFLKAIPGKSLMRYARKTPIIFEVNHLIRNEHTSGQSPALNIVNASELLQNPSKLNLLANKVVFMGVFNPYQNTYGAEQVVYPTPIQENMSSSMLSLNAYLNVVTNSFFHRAGHRMVFWFNLLLVILTLFYYHKTQYIKEKSLRLQVGELLIPILIFFLFLLLLYWHFHLKFPFVITSIAFVRSIYFFKKFNQLYFFKKQ